MALAELPRAFCRNETESRILARLSTVKRWQDPENILNLPFQIAESDAEHTSQSLSISSQTLENFPRLASAINPIILKGIILVHDLGEYGNGDTLGTKKEQLQAEGKLDDLRKLERLSVVKIAKEMGLPEFVIQLYDEYENWQDEESLSFPLESVFAQFIDKFNNERTYTINRFRLGTKPSKILVENELRTKTYARRVFHRLNALYERAPKRLDVMILAHNVVEWMAGDYVGQIPTAREELLRASTFDFPEYARFIDRNKGYHPQKFEDPMESYYKPSLFK